MDTIDPTNLHNKDIVIRTLAVATPGEPGQTVHLPAEEEPVHEHNPAHVEHKSVQKKENLVSLLTIQLPTQDVLDKLQHNQRNVTLQTVAIGENGETTPLVTLVANLNTVTATALAHQHQHLLKLQHLHQL